jgi:hypothetical protein
MLRVFVEVHEEAAPLRVEVRAESISQAIGTVEEVHPGRTVQLVFPIDSQEFLRRRSAGGRGTTGPTGGERSLTIP